MPSLVGQSLRRGTPVAALVVSGSSPMGSVVLQLLYRHENVNTNIYKLKKLPRLLSRYLLKQPR